MSTESDPRHAFPHEPDLNKLAEVWPLNWSADEAGIKFRDTAGGYPYIVAEIDVNHAVTVEAWDGKWLADVTSARPEPLRVGPGDDVYDLVRELRTMVEGGTQHPKGLARLVIVR